MTDPRLIANQLDTGDIKHLAERYDFTQDFVRGLNDHEWSELLGCGLNELPFYLFDDDTFDTYLEDFADLGDADDFYDEDNPVEGSFDLSEVIERQLREPAIASAPMPKPIPISSGRKPAPKKAASKVTTKPRTYTQYSSPSHFARKVNPAKVTHHFELVN